jgi:organic radical activating enzyme
MDGANLPAARASAIDYVMAHPKWRLSTQTHKVVGIR